MLKLLVFLLCITLGSSACSSQQTIINENRKVCCYYDSQNIPTIGIGFNLQRADASTVMAMYNLTLSNVLQDCVKKTNKNCLKSSQADDIFNRISYPEAESCADRYVANLPTNKRAAIVDVAFAGCATLNKFVKLKAALEKKDWQQAGTELRTSLWCTQVGQNRCNADYNCIIEGTCSGGFCGSYTRGCSSNPNCYCFKTSNGTGFCALSAQCSQYGDCSSCSSSTSVCLVNTCCLTPKCMPLSLNATCTSTSTRHISNIIEQSDFKLSNEKTTAGR